MNKAKAEEKSEHQKLFEETVKKLATTPKEQVAQQPNPPKKRADSKRKKP